VPTKKTGKKRMIHKFAACNKKARFNETVCGSVSFWLLENIIHLNNDLNEVPCNFQKQGKFTTPRTVKCF
jgi:hypothetical protein